MKFSAFRPWAPRRCRHIVVNGYSDPHACPWDAGSDGYCWRHHPSERIRRLRASNARMLEKIAENERLIAMAKEELDELEIVIGTA